MKVKLAEGRALRDPTTRAMMRPDEVRDVPDHDVYWHRRLRDGDVVPAETPIARHGRHPIEKEA